MPLAIDRYRNRRRVGRDFANRGLGHPYKLDIHHRGRYLVNRGPNRPRPGNPQIITSGRAGEGKSPHDQPGERPGKP
jgi:hypothetical protein